jgi:hypothetical protein
MFDDYCLISNKLLLFLKWISNNDPDLISEFVKKAYDGGFKEFIDIEKDLNNLSTDDLNVSIVNFFNIIENSFKHLNKNNSTNKEEKLGINIYSESVIGNLLEPNHTKNNTSPHSSTLSDKESILKDFLKKWEPKNKMVH